MNAGRGHLRPVFVCHGAVDIGPFDSSGDVSCRADSNPLLAEDIPLSIFGIPKLGFASAIPEFDAAHAGTAEAASLPRDADVLILWEFFHGGQAGDTAPT